MSRPPSAFVSSTCYDLGQVRQNLKHFIESVGYEPVLSEYSSFPVNPDLDTVENCRRVVSEKADIFILIVGGRYGSVADHGKSVTNLEYLQARAKGIPIFVFAQKSILNLLPVWRGNARADFSMVVDSTKVLEFISSIRDSGDAWVFPFETAQEIVDTLRVQFAYLCMDGLNLRRRAKEAALPEVLKGLQGKAFRIALEKPEAWEYRLFGQVLADCLKEHTSLRRDWEYAVTFGATESRGTADLFTWSQNQLAQLTRIGNGLSKLVNVALQEALGPPGVPGNPEALVYVARRISDGYREAIQWSLRFRCITVDPEFTELTRILGHFSSDIIQKVEGFSARLLSGLESQLTLPPEQRETLEVSLVLILPELDAYDREVQRLQALLASGWTPAT